MPTNVIQSHRFIFWFKNKFLGIGDKFTITSDKVREYICKDISVEKTYIGGKYTYRPDVTIDTECGQTVYFEMAFSNKKKVKDYLDVWLELKNIVVEVDIKKMMFKDKAPTFKALFYDGKCFNTKKNDTYYNIIGRYKEDKLIGKVDEKLKERIRKLDWFWDDLIRYSEGKQTIEDLKEIIKLIDIKDKYILLKILKTSSCSDVKSIYIDLKEELKRYEELDNTCYLDRPFSKDNLIKKAVQKLNRKYRKIDNRFKVSLLRDSHKCKEEKYFNGRKNGVWKVSSYHYQIILEHELHRFWDVESINVTNRIVEMQEVDDIFDFIDEKLSKYELRIECKDCKDNFNLSNNEIEFFTNKGFELPKRCKFCRQKRKRNKLA